MKALRSDLTFSYLSECFHLDADRGVLIWKVRPVEHFASRRAMTFFNNHRAGTVAGTVKTDEGRARAVVQLNRQCVFVHRVIYALHHSIDIDDVPDVIDHEDRDTLKNRPGNLREATPTQNNFNRILPLGRSGVRGVTYQPKFKTWRARVKKGGREINLGSFPTKEEAGAAWKAAAETIHGC